MIGAIFPGQGGPGARSSQEMLSHPDTRRLYDQASEIFGQTVPLYGSSDFERSDLVTKQVALVVSSLAGWSWLEHHRAGSPQIVAGLSLGEYSAAIAIGVLSLEEGIRVVSGRADCMGRYGCPGSVAVVLGLPFASLKGILDALNTSAGRPLVLHAGTYGSHEMVVVGTDAGLTLLSEKVDQARGRMVRLAVTVASHSSFMDAAMPCIQNVMSEAKWRRASIPWVSGIDGHITRDPESIRGRLLAQTVTPISWPAAITSLIRYGVTLFLDVGPGTSAGRLARRVDSAARVATWNGPGSHAAP